MEVLTFFIANPSDFLVFFCFFNIFPYEKETFKSYDINVHIF